MNTITLFKPAFSTFLAGADNVAVRAIDDAVLKKAKHALAGPLPISNEHHVSYALDSVAEYICGEDPYHLPYVIQSMTNSALAAKEILKADKSVINYLSLLGHGCIGSEDVAIVGNMIDHHLCEVVDLSLMANTINSSSPVGGSQALIRAMFNHLHDADDLLSYALEYRQCSVNGHLFGKAQVGKS